MNKLKIYTCEPQEINYLIIESNGIEQDHILINLRQGRIITPESLVKQFVRISLPKDSTKYILASTTSNYVTVLKDMHVPKMLRHSLVGTKDYLNLVVDERGYIVGFQPDLSEFQRAYYKQLKKKRRLLK